MNAAEAIVILDRDHPARRWRRVELLVTNGTPPPRNWKDPLVRRGFHFLRRYRQMPETERPALAEDFPDIAAAYAIYSDPTSARWIIEAGLLTTAGTAEIGAYVGQDAAVIETYAALFFDVRDRLGAEGYLFCNVFGPPADPEQQPAYREWKVFAHAYGWPAFCDFLGGTVSPEIREQMDAAARANLLRKAFAAAHLMEIDDSNCVRVLQLCVRMLVGNAREHPDGNESEDLEILQGIIEQAQASKQTTATC